MKRFNIIIMLLSVIIFFNSCKSVKKVSCDAYGKNENEDVEFDIQKINSESNTKYITTYVIK